MKVKMFDLKNGCKVEINDQFDYLCVTVTRSVLGQTFKIDGRYNVSSIRIPFWKVCLRHTKRVVGLVMEESDKYKRQKQKELIGRM